MVFLSCASPNVGAFFSAQQQHKDSVSKPAMAGIAQVVGMVHLPHWRPFFALQSDELHQYLEDSQPWTNASQPGNFKLNSEPVVTRGQSTGSCLHWPDSSTATWISCTKSHFGRTRNLQKAFGTAISAKWGTDFNKRSRSSSRASR